MILKLVYNKIVKYLEAEKNIDFFTETLIQRKEIERLTSIMQGPQNDGLELNTNSVIITKRVLDTIIEKLIQQISALVVLIQIAFN